MNAFNCDCAEWELECQHAQKKLADKLEHKAFVAEAHLHPLDFRPPPELWIDIYDNRQMNKRYNAGKV